MNTRFRKILVMTVISAILLLPLPLAFNGLMFAQAAPSKDFLTGKSEQQIENTISKMSITSMLVLA